MDGSQSTDQRGVFDADPCWKSNPKGELSTFNELSVSISIAAFHYAGNHILICGTPGPTDRRLRTISSDDVAN